MCYHSYVEYFPWVNIRKRPACSVSVIDLCSIFRWLAVCIATSYFVGCLYTHRHINFIFAIITSAMLTRLLQGSENRGMLLLRDQRKQLRGRITYLYSDHAHKWCDIDCELPEKQKLNGFALTKNTAGTSQVRWRDQQYCFYPSIFSWETSLHRILENSSGLCECRLESSGSRQGPAAGCFNHASGFLHPINTEDFVTVFRQVEQMKLTVWCVSRTFSKTLHRLQVATWY
jgi:hypothetical protein